MILRGETTQEVDRKPVSSLPIHHSHHWVYKGGSATRAWTRSNHRVSHCKTLKALTRTWQLNSLGVQNRILFGTRMSEITYAGWAISISQSPAEKTHSDMDTHTHTLAPWFTVCVVCGGLLAILELNQWFFWPVTLTGGNLSYNLLLKLDLFASSPEPLSTPSALGWKQGPCSAS